MNLVKAKWDKGTLVNGKKEPMYVDVVILDFVSVNTEASARPVAVIADMSEGGQLRYAELKFLKVEP